MQNMHAFVLFSLLILHHIVVIQSECASQICYTCDDNKTCRYKAGPDTDLQSIKSCVQVCHNENEKVEERPTRWQVGKIGTCQQCPVEIESEWEFGDMLSALGLTDRGWDQGGCTFGAFLTVVLPNDWVVTGNWKCAIEDLDARCFVRNRVLEIKMSKKHMNTLLGKEYGTFTRITIPALRSPGGPSSQSIVPMKMHLESTGCSIFGSNVVQNIDLQLPFNAGAIVTMGTFKDLRIASRTSSSSTSTMSITFISGGAIRVGSSFILKSKNTLLQNLFQQASAKIIQPLDVTLKTSFEGGNIVFTIPTTFNNVIENGEPVVIIISNVKTQEKSPSNFPERVSFEGRWNGKIVMEATETAFVMMSPELPNTSYNAIDILTSCLFGFFMLVSIWIVRLHGLYFTPTKVWTDMVAISVILSFASGCIAFLTWIFHPSEAFVYLSAVQYIFQATMIISLCFHWGSVLSLALFKKLTLKSKVVMLYILCNLLVVVGTIVSLTYHSDKLDCVYGQSTLLCESSECSNTPRANGQPLRDAINECNLGGYYITITVMLVMYTLLLMVLGCMVLNRGRVIMLGGEIRDAARIRKSLTVFYIIIATTCVLYVSAEVLYLAQYSAGGQDLDDIIWYTFVVWLPQVGPPLMLLFLQWNPKRDVSNTSNDSIVLLEDIEQRDQSNTNSFIMKQSETPTSLCSPNSSFRKMGEIDLSRRDHNLSLLNDDLLHKTRLMIRLTVPATFQRTAFLSLDYCTTTVPLQGLHSLRLLGRSATWNPVGSTEQVRIGSFLKKDNSSDTVDNVTVSFLALLEVPATALASNTIIRFILHCSNPALCRLTHTDEITVAMENMEDVSILSSEEAYSRNSSAEVEFPITYTPLCEFVTTLKAVMDATATQHSLTVTASEENTCTILETDNEKVAQDVEELLGGNREAAQLSIQTVLMVNTTVAPSKNNDGKNREHQKMGNITRFFQYDSEDGTGGLVVEDLRECVFANSIPRQVLELLASERQSQYHQARIDLNAFLSQKKTKTDSGFYGTLLAQIQDEGDTTLAREWLEMRLKARKEYVSLLRDQIQYLVIRDKNKAYFKPSVDKSSEELRFVPLNLHVQDLKVGPRRAFINDDRRNAKLISTYEFTTVGAMAAHTLKFKNGGILSMQKKIEEMGRKITDGAIESGKWPEELRDYENLQWDVTKRMDICFIQAMTTLVASFVRKVELALLNPDVQKGGDMLRQISTLGYLFHVESLLSTHGKEIGMLEDMAAAIARLSTVSFVIQDITDRPTGRFSFRVPRKKTEKEEEMTIMKVQVSEKPRSTDGVKYVVTLQVHCGAVGLPEKVASGAEIGVTPVLFTQGINEMQSIANSAEKSKTELQDLININNLRPLKAYCDKYCRLAVALPPAILSVADDDYLSGPSRLYRSLDQAPMRLGEDEVLSAYNALELSILEASQSSVKTKHTEILTKSADFCRELGAGRVTICKSAKDRTGMSVTLEQGRILERHHGLPKHRVAPTVSVMRSHGVRIENSLKNTGKRMYAFNKIQRSLLPEEYRCPVQVGGSGNVS